MIPKINYQSRNAEVDGTVKRMLNAWNSAGIVDDAHLATIFNLVDAGEKKLLTAINRSKAESQLEEKDEVRDNQFRLLYNLVQGGLGHPDPLVRGAAQKLFAILDKYSMAIINENYVTESSLLGSLLEELSDTSLETSIAAVSGCAELIAALQAAQDDFENIRTAYEKEKDLDSKTVNATTLKKQIVRTINKKLVPYLRVVSENDDAKYGGLAGTLTQIIADNNEVVKKRLADAEPVAG
ncbi:DUF6261 family protein [Prolixibacter sp. SD074]|jgi:hypothetical protein|uniref:DUF6261 family protein n=1 Tax=Prolixibacter sp. SD074 TaxID=2652391 RepID=UPI001275E8D0|nr:DUF6261 family protein [Prolixibacter sp. SD074]GET29191.1 hypothetical protein SD074_13930 [Prolixibacter sp. SD074]